MTNFNFKNSAAFKAVQNNNNNNNNKETITMKKDNNNGENRGKRFGGFIVNVKKQQDPSPRYGQPTERAVAAANIIAKKKFMPVDLGKNPLAFGVNSNLNYGLNGITSTGETVNMFGPAHMAAYLPILRKHAANLKEALNCDDNIFDGITVREIATAMKEMAASYVGKVDILKEEFYELIPDEKDKLAAIGYEGQSWDEGDYYVSPLKTEVKNGFETQTLQSLDEVNAVIAAGQAMNWCDDGMHNVAAFLLDLEAVCRFFVEKGIDATKKFPVGGLPIPRKECLKSYKKLSKRGNFVLEFAWEKREITTKVTAVTETATDTGVVRSTIGLCTETAPGLKIDKNTREVMLKLPGACPDPYAVLRMHGFKVAQFFAEDCIGHFESEFPKELEALCVKRAENHRYNNFIIVAEQQKAIRQSITKEFARREHYVLTEVCKGNKQSEIFENFCETQKGQKKVAYAAIENTLRATYRNCGISSNLAVSILLGITLRDWRKAQANNPLAVMSDFARQALPAEFAKFILDYMYKSENKMMAEVGKTYTLKTCDKVQGQNVWLENGEGEGVVAAEAISGKFIIDIVNDTKVAVRVPETDNNSCYTVEFPLKKRDLNVVEGDIVTFEDGIGIKDGKIVALAEEKMPDGTYAVGFRGKTAYAVNTVMNIIQADIDSKDAKFEDGLMIRLRVPNGSKLESKVVIKKLNDVCSDIQGSEIRLDAKSGKVVKRRKGTDRGYLASEWASYASNKLMDWLNIRGFVTFTLVSNYNLDANDSRATAFAVVSKKG